MWRKVDVSRFGLIYAGAQKNLGPSGVVVVLVKKDLVAAGRKDIPKIFQYRTVAENNSLYNTPPRSGSTWFATSSRGSKARAGSPRSRRRTARRRGSSTGRSTVTRASIAPGREAEPVGHERRLPPPTEALEEKFIGEAKKLKMIGLKGHRSVGGVRVSLYNAVGLEWVKTLTDFMKDFAKANG